MTQKKMKLMLINLVSILLSVYVLFVFTLGTAYHTETLDKLMNIEKTKVSQSDLEKTCEYLIEGLNSASEALDISDGKSSELPYSFSSLCEKLNDSFGTVSEKYEFIQCYHSRAKKIIISKPMTYTHISGVYSFFTGEANVNVNYPDYILPFTVAHEMAHQRGIAREDEANFVAFLVCISSEDDYIRYSGYTQVFEYAANALYSENPTAYYEVAKKLDKKYVQEAGAYSDFISDYNDSPISDVSTSVNNTFQQMQGQSAGVKSYGFVVDLAVAYYKSSEKSNPQ